MRTSEQVESLLKNLPETRNSDKALLVAYMQRAGMELNDRQIAMYHELPSAETITRVRRELQEQGKYPASEKVDKARFNKYKHVRENVVQAKDVQSLLDWADGR